MPRTGIPHLYELGQRCRSRHLVTENFFSCRRSLAHAFFFAHAALPPPSPAPSPRRNVATELHDDRNNGLVLRAMPACARFRAKVLALSAALRLRGPAA